MDNNLNIPSIPHLVHIETTYSCNGNCVFCYNPKRGNKFNKKKVDKIVKSIHKSWVPHVYLIGGEPSLLGVEQLNRYIDFLSERSSVTVVTNGLICLRGISKNLACIGIPFHGTEAIHERHTQMVGGYKKAITTTKYYVSRGLDVRCIPVLTAWNFNQMYDVIKVAKKLGMESVFVDRFEDGGIGSKNSDTLKLSPDQFGIALGQMIAARDDFNIPVGFGTAIPYCLDERLITENMFANCGAGFTFCAVSPEGDVRACNQSEISYGNVIEGPIEQIWKNKELNKFRDLSWVTTPCCSCVALKDCLCGCKVDSSFSSGYSIDYAVRGKTKSLEPALLFPKLDPLLTHFDGYRSIKLDRYVKLNKRYQEHYLITRYQTIEINKEAQEIIEFLIGGESSEENLVLHFSRYISEQEIRLFLDRLFLIGAIKFC